MSQILFALLGFNALVVVHELGHFLVARWCGMRVLRFSVGLGPPLVRIRGKVTDFQVCVFPIGGYVTIAGMTGRDPDTSPGSYLSATRWQRAAMVAAGPFFNLVATLVIYLYLIASFGALTWPPVGSNGVLDAEGPAAAAGLRRGDVIVALDGQPVRNIIEINDRLGKAQHGSTAEVVPVRLTVARPPDLTMPRKLEPTAEAGVMRSVPAVDPAWEHLELTVTPLRISEGRVRLGVFPDFISYGAEAPLQVLALSAEKVWYWVDRSGRLLGRIFTGRQAPELSSVVKITQEGADTLRLGGSTWFLNFLAIISVGLCLLNLLPFPPLDGGRLLFLAIEAVARRPIPLRVQNAIQGIGIVLLLGLMAVVTVRDTIQLF